MLDTEKRSDKRYKVHNETVSVSSDGKQWNEATVIDISQNGLCLEVKNKYFKDSLLYLRGKIKGCEAAISCDIKVVHCSEVANGLFTIGVVYRNLSLQQENDLSDAIKKAG